MFHPVHVGAGAGLGPRARGGVGDQRAVVLNSGEHPVSQVISGAEAQAGSPQVSQMVEHRIGDQQDHEGHHQAGVRFVQQSLDHLGDVGAGTHTHHHQRHGGRQRRSGLEQKGPDGLNDRR